MDCLRLRIMQASRAGALGQPTCRSLATDAHITFDVVTGGVVVGNWKVEASAFRGREPDQYRYDIEAPKFDSYSARLSWNPTGRLTLEQATRTMDHAERTATVARKAGRGEQGSVEIGYVGSAFSGILSKITFDYRKTNPDIELQLHELDITQQVDDVSNGRIDVGLIRPPVRQWPDRMASLTLSREPIICPPPDLSSRSGSKSGPQLRGPTRGA